MSQEIIGTRWKEEMHHQIVRSDAEQPAPSFILSTIFGWSPPPLRGRFGG